MTVSEAISALQTKVMTLSEIKAAPSEPPEEMGQFPFAVAYPKSGAFRLESAGFGTYLHTLICEIHMARIMLPRAVAQAIPYIESFAGLLIADPTLSGSVTAVNAVRYEFGRLSWAGEEHIGVRFEIDVKILQS
jgi:hypothetical protein